MRVALLAVAAAASLPQHGTLVPGRSLGGVRLGEPAARVRAQLGAFYGTCRGCAVPTWYFTYRPFDDRGLAVELTRGRVTGLFTLWRPGGWTGPHGLALGSAEGDVTRTVGAVIPLACSGYTALVTGRGATRTVYYVVDGALWGFGLFRGQASPCR